MREIEKSHERQKKNKFEDDSDIWKEAGGREKWVRDAKEGRGTCLQL